VLAVLAALVGGAGPPLRSPGHVVVIVFENKESSSINARTAPTFAALGKRYARITNYHAVTHPSLPNYLALVSGSTHGITSDCESCRVSGRTIGDQLTDAGLTWKAYAEGFPDSPRYRKHHVPFLYFSRGTNHVVALSRFDPRRLPDFAFVVPDFCHSMHDCSVAVGDRWLRSFAAPLLKLPGTVVFVVFDEGGGPNHVAALALGTLVRPGSVYAGRVDHYGLLRTLEDAWGLAPLGHAAAASPVTGIFR
jgi:hypothetical protein